MRRTADTRLLLQAILLGIVYYLLARPAAELGSPSGTLTAIAWPAPACAIAWLWLKPRHTWPPFLLAVFVSMIAVGKLDWLPWHGDLAFAALNVLEVALCAWLGQTYVDRAGKLASTPALIRLLLLLPLSATALVAVLGATIASLTIATDWWQEWRTLFVGNGFAILVLVPALLASSLSPDGSGSPAWRRVACVSALSGVLAVIVAVSATTALHSSVEVQRGLLSLILVTTAIYGGMRSAALTVGVAGALGSALALADLGPYGHDDANSIWRLQVDMSGLAMLSFFVAVATWERRQLAARLERARRLETLGLLASGVAHDFNNILAVVKGYVEITETHLPPDSPAMTPLREVLLASDRGQDLSEQIMHAARRGEHVRETLGLHEIACEAVAFARPLLPAGITLEIEPSNSLPLVAAHRGQLVRAVLNLVRNASQAACTHVTVRTMSGSESPAPMEAGDTPPGPAAWIEIEDDGAGIAPEHLPYIFAPFYSRRAGGDTGGAMGLGLAIVAGIASEHQGGIWVRTGANGSCFRLVLPLFVETGPVQAPVLNGF